MVDLELKIIGIYDTPTYIFVFKYWNVLSWFILSLAEHKT